MTQSENITELLQSLAKAQSEFPTMPKDSKGYGYKYTAFDTIVTLIKPILSKYGLGYLQPITFTEDGHTAITTRIFDSKGNYIEDTALLPSVSLAKGNEAQNLGAAITYMRRYTLSSMLGISCDEDVDGSINATQNTPDKKQEENHQQSPAPKKGNYTKEEADTCGSLLNCTYPDGTPVFSGEDRLQYKRMLMKSGADTVKAIASEKDKRCAAWKAPVQGELY
jgi:hypothetical protein